MRFATRTFLWSFVPLAVLLMASFWTTQTLVVSAVRDGIRTSMRQTHRSIARSQSKSELQYGRFLKVVAESAALKAGVELMLAEPQSSDARLTVEDQLKEICRSLGFYFLLISNPEGDALAGIMRVGEELVAIDPANMRPPQKGFLPMEERTYQLISAAMNQGDERIGTLIVGEPFDFSQFSMPTVLTKRDAVLESTVPGIVIPEVESGLRGCPADGECEVQLRGETFLSLPMRNLSLGDGYLIRSLQSVDSASGPVQAILLNVFLVAAAGALLGAVVLGALSSRSVVQPIAAVVSHLRASERTGVLPEFHANHSTIREIRELTDSFNRAADSIRAGRVGLEQAYVECVEALASALDARDRYTAGHSRRVSAYACSIAEAMNFTVKDLDEIRVGALLHDIGKIGIPDGVLQKPGRLTHEEMTLIQQHPTIGRRILEGVNGFQSYLPTVELHHENWDGTGYPRGLRGEAVPLAPRIVHVVDAYDAMTSDRPYRPGMSHAEAIRVLEKNAGTQFDAEIVRIFLGLNSIGEIRHIQADVLEQEVRSVHHLAEAVKNTGAYAPSMESIKS